MPQLRRLAIHAENPAQLAAFYQNVFDLEKIGEAGGAVFVSDGTFSLAFLPMADGISSGFSYMCFETVGIESIREKVPATRARAPCPVELCGGEADHDVQDPDHDASGPCSKS